MSRYIRLRGLPWSVTHQEILNFLKNVNVVNGPKGINLVTSRWDGKNTGEAFVELEGEQDEEEAFKHNKETLGHRYIEIFSASSEEAELAMRKTGAPSCNVVKLRGLPYAITEGMISDFFKGLDIKPDREGILIVMDRKGRASGEAYVQFQTQEHTEQALRRNREKIGHRYIEIFRSSVAEMKRQSGNRPGPYDKKDRGNARSITRHDFNIRSNGARDIWSNNFASNEVNFNSNGRFNNSGGFNSGLGDFKNFGNNRGNVNSGSGDDFSGNSGNFGNSSNVGDGNVTGCGSFGPIGNGRNDSDLFCIHMRGLPYNSFEKDVLKFFEPLRVATVKIIYNNKGLHSGTADALFETYEEAIEAMKRDKEQMGNRYIELFFDGKSPFSRHI